jgi:hypothetical protein
MPRIDLQVPFAEKDAAKHLGARWDSQNTTWYVPDGIDATPLQKWIPVHCRPTSEQSTDIWRRAHTPVLTRLSYLAARRDKASSSRNLCNMRPGPLSS